MERSGMRGLHTSAESVSPDYASASALTRFGGPTQTRRSSPSERRLGRSIRATKMKRATARAGPFDFQSRAMSRRDNPIGSRAFLLFLLLRHGHILQLASVIGRSRE